MKYTKATFNIMHSTDDTTAAHVRFAPKEVSGYTLHLEITRDELLTLHKDGGWKLSDWRTGGLVATGNTREEAAACLIDRMNNYGHRDADKAYEVFKKAQEYALKTFGVCNL